MVLIFWTTIRNSDHPHPERARVFVCGKDERKARPHQNSISSHRFSSPAILSVFSRRKQQIFFKVWFWTMIFPKRFLRSTGWVFFFLAKKSWHPGVFLHPRMCVGGDDFAHRLDWSPNMSWILKSNWLEHSSLSFEVSSFFHGMLICFQVLKC